MEKCLVTTLKGTVNNDSLLKVGEFVVYIDEQSTADYSKRGLKIRNLSRVDNIVVDIIGGYFTNNTGSQNLGTTATIPPASVNTVYSSNHNCTLKIRSKYDTCVVSGESNGTHLYYANFDTFNYFAANVDEAKDQTEINMQNEKNTGTIKDVFGVISLLAIKGAVYGDVTNWKFGSSSGIYLAPNTGLSGELNVGDFDRIYFEGCRNIKLDLSKLVNKTFNQIRMNYTNTVGSINNISSVNANRIELTGCSNVTGTVEGVVANMWAKGRRSDSFSLQLVGTNITLNGKVMTSEGLSCTFSSTGVNVTGFNTGKRYASYNGSSWTY